MPNINKRLLFYGQKKNVLYVLFGEQFVINVFGPLDSHGYELGFVFVIRNIMTLAESHYH